MPVGDARGTILVKSRLVLVGALCGAALVASACGTRLDDREFRRVNSGVGGAGEAAAPGADGESATGEMVGTLPMPCNPGPDDRSAFTDTDQGVTADTVKIATIADPGGPKPGLNQGVFDSMEALIGWCNDLGGINGREVELELIDGKILNYNEAVVQACSSAFAMVGSLGVLDNLGTASQLACGLPSTPAAAVNPEQTGADLTYQSLPNPPWTFKVSPGEWLAQERPEVVDAGAAIYTDLPTTQMQAERQVEAYEQIGYDFPVVSPSDLNEQNWGPIVTEMKNKGVTYMTLSASFEEMIPLAKEMDRQDFHPVVELETNYYNDKFPEQAGGVADGFYIRAQTWPFEEAADNAAMAKYLEVMETYKPDGVREYLGLQAFSAGLYFLQAANAAGPDLTRASLIAELEKIDRWDAGGLQAPTAPSKNQGTSCFIMLKVEDGGYVREYPKPDEDADVYNNDIAPGYACPDSKQVELTGDDYRSMGMTVEQAKQQVGG